MFTPDPAAMPTHTQAAGEGYFTALSITDVTLPNPNDQFLFNPHLIFPQVQGSPENSEVGAPLVGFQRRLASILLVPVKGLTFANSGLAPMLTFRRIDLGGQRFPPPTLLSYQGAPQDLIIFAPNNPNPIPTVGRADPSSFVF